jgi:hypothetical protein
MASTSVLVQIPVDFRLRNEDAAKSWQFPKHLPTHEPSDRLFANAQFRRAASYVERLTFGGRCCCVHNQSFTSQQPTTHRNFFGVAATQAVIVHSL